MTCRLIVGETDSDQRLSYGCRYAFVISRSGVRILQPAPVLSQTNGGPINRPGKLGVMRAIVSARSHSDWRRALSVAIDELTAILWLLTAGSLVRVRPGEPIFPRSWRALVGANRLVGSAAASYPGRAVAPFPQTLENDIKHRDQEDADRAGDQHPGETSRRLICAAPWAKTSGTKPSTKAIDVIRSCSGA